MQINVPFSGIYGNKCTQFGNFSILQRADYEGGTRVTRERRGGEYTNSECYSHPHTSFGFLRTLVNDLLKSRSSLVHPSCTSDGEPYEDGGVPDSVTENQHRQTAGKQPVQRAPDKTAHQCRHDKHEIEGEKMNNRIQKYRQRKCH